MDRVWKIKTWIDQLKLESVSLDFATGGETGVSGAPVASLVWLETRTDFYKVLIRIWTYDIFIIIILKLK